MKYRSEAQRRAIMAQYGGGGSKTIHRGFKVHRVGKRIRQAGFGAAAIGLGGVAATDVTRIFANPTLQYPFARTHVAVAKMIQPIQRSPLVQSIQRTILPHITPIEETITRGLRAAAFKVKMFPQAAAAARVMTKANPAFQSAMKYGVPVGVAGAGIAWAGGKLIQHGFKQSKKRRQMMSGRTPFRSWSL